MGAEPQPDRPGPDVGRDAHERADLLEDMEEDRRRQQDLDDGELGGEA